MAKGFNGDWRFLSNFFPSEIEFEGITYPTVEHAYQAMKVLNPKRRQEIADCATASKAKQMGRELVLREDWDDIKITVMETLLRKKFYNPILRSALIMTGDAELVEYNYWHDNFWGMCTCLKHQGQGENHLGRLLMELRAILRAETKVSVLG